MGDSFELTLNSRLTDEDWDKITDAEFENSDRITFRTPSGKTVEFAKVSEEFEWCHDCKEYDAERHCCPRWTKVIRNTVEEVRQGRPKGKWITDKYGNVMCSACRWYAPKVMKGCFTTRRLEYSKTDFCGHCGADMREEEDNGTD